MDTKVHNHKNESEKKEILEFSLLLVVVVVVVVVVD